MRSQSPGRLALVSGVVIAAATALLGCVSTDRSATGTPSEHGVTEPPIPVTESAIAPPGYILHAEANPHPSAATRWLDIIEETAARRVDRVGAKPTIISRDMMIACTAMYDAWACYDEKAVGTRLGGSLRQPPSERTAANREAALGLAVTRCLEDLYREDVAWIDDQARSLGVDPGDRSLNEHTASGIGNRVAAAVIAYRHHDGSNQLGDAPGSDGSPYSDDSGYAPVRPPGAVPDPDHWMPIVFSDGKGGTLTPGFLTPHWSHVIPVGFTRADHFRAPPPPKADSAQMRREVDECIECNGTLSLAQKALVEFMRDGPRSTGQSGHWLLFAQDVSRRDHYDLEQDVKLYFCVSCVAFDSFIACWDSKRFYDTSRPYWYVRYLHHGEMVKGYAGPGQGFKLIRAEDWHPYSPETFVTPPFPGYTSGHATVSGASSKMLELFTGSDRFGVIARRCAGELTEAGVPTSVMQAVDGAPALGVQKECYINLRLATFSETAELAALSRMLGGYHIRADNDAGLIMGRQVAAFCYPVYTAYFTGHAPVHGR